MAGFHQHGSELVFGKAADEPFRERSSFQTDPAQGRGIGLQPSGDRRGLACDLRLQNDRPVAIDDTDCRLVQRDIQRSLKIHGGLLPGSHSAQDCSERAQ